MHFPSNSTNTSSRSARCLFCVCAEKKSSVHTQPSLFKRETNKKVWTELLPGLQIPTLWAWARASAQDKLMLSDTQTSLKEHWREECICLAVEFKHQQAFSRIVDYTFKWCSMKKSVLVPRTFNEMDPLFCYWYSKHLRPLRRQIPLNWWADRSPQVLFYRPCGAQYCNNLTTLEPVQEGIKLVTGPSIFRTRTFPSSKDGERDGNCRSGTFDSSPETTPAFIYKT